MQMRHLYRSPRCICLSSSLIRAFRASMVVAVDSSSVTLVRRATVSDSGGGIHSFTYYIFQIPSLFSPSVSTSILQSPCLPDSPINKLSPKSGCNQTTEVRVNTLVPLILGEIARWEINMLRHAYALIRLKLDNTRHMHRSRAGVGPPEQNHSIKPALAYSGLVFPLKSTRPRGKADITYETNNRPH